ncbi:carboxylating nicotinate-nucleotide diphosphorylase [Dichotomicrobium thermohalophilum]|uniref:Probable nicotinate-nucleotide pyrophosphorylase [carboxylating] n=1 Tax=Dichotomicrobium thermohalophilum TaxID=933063 RepID=A0A397Q673_9HYPH|nr:carboxylating nicotinate-nucleotide diphosphorylase [Dichotomicrobium thermohalophilum]RIA55037.1 nicotinate-nucleotide pyrophosphorylase [carboxylating] [Dichotomicrobium thermohalophilum]
MTDLIPPPEHLLEEAVTRALREDLGLAGDITSTATIPATQTSEARIVVREPGVVAGLPLAQAAVRALDTQVAFAAQVADGDPVETGTELALITGNTRTLLSAERVALNFLGRLSGIATLTAQYVAAVSGTQARITCTRKTTPGLRALEKYAVRAGGGVNHRFGLFDGVLIKDNHVAASGGVGPAVERARAAAGHMVRIEVEVDTLAQLDEALALGVDAILLDNMSLDDLREAVARTGGRALLEASGGVSLETVGAIAATGVDLISAGALTHSARCLDVALDFASGG